MKLVFSSGGEVVILLINRKQKKLRIASSKTDYKVLNRPWTDLFDPGKEKLQEVITTRLNDEQFKREIEISMDKIGYKRLTKEDINNIVENDLTRSDGK